MAISKTGTAVQASASNSAGGSTTSSAVDLTTKLGGTLTAKITNGASGPTIGCSVYLEVSHDNSAWKEFARGMAGVTANAVYPFAFDIPPSILYARTRFQDNTGQPVTVESQLHQLNSAS